MDVPLESYARHRSLLFDVSIESEPYPPSLLVNVIVRFPELTYLNSTFDMYVRVTDYNDQMTVSMPFTVCTTCIALDNRPNRTL